MSLFFFVISHLDSDIISSTTDSDEEILNRLYNEVRGVPHTSRRRRRPRNGAVNRTRPYSCSK